MILQSAGGGSGKSVYLYKGGKMFNAKIIDDFISKEDCDYLISVAKDSGLWMSGGSDFWDNRIINYYDMLKLDKRSAQIMIDANIRCGQTIKDIYELSSSVYSDTLQVVRWFPGMEQPPHADDMTNTDVPNFEHRVFGSIIYLNNNYSGGHTYYPGHNVDISPAAGRLAIHPGDPEHLHGVTKIEDDIRYTIASFWTYEKEKSHEWPLP
jgi:hypothetical protein